MDDTNCFKTCSDKELEDALFLETSFRENPCIYHSSPWICAMYWNKPRTMLKLFHILSKLNINAWHMGKWRDNVLLIDEFTVYAFRILSPIDSFGEPSAFYDGNVTVLLRAYKIILNNMRRQNKAARLSVPKHVIFNLQSNYFDTLSYLYRSESTNREQSEKELSYTLNALHLSLSAGANIHQKKCRFSTPSCSCKKIEKSNLAFHVKPKLLAQFSQPNNITSTTALRPEYFAKLAEFYEVLFVHGNKPDKQWRNFVSQVVSFQKPELFKLGGMTLSLMDHEDWQHVQRKLSILHKRAVRSVPGNAEEEETKTRKLKLIETYRGPKSLQDMCRKVLYDNVPDCRMVKYVGHLPLPTLVKQYLLFH